jgi:hypothetical protein
LASIACSAKRGTVAVIILPKVVPGLIDPVRKPFA